jgi:hypothetical protein
VSKETNRLAATIGIWSSLLGVLTFVIFTVSFVGIAVSGPVAEWTTLEDYVATTRQHSQALKHLAQICMLAFAPLFVMLLNSIHEYAADDKKILTRIGLSFAIAAMVLIGAMYFVQLSTVRLSIQNDQFDGIEHFMQFYPNSAMLSIGMLGWTLFLGLSTLFVAPVFSGTRLNTVIRGALFATSAACLLGGVGFVLDSFWLVFLTINFGMGAALIVSMLALTVFFYRLGRSPSDPVMA